MINSLIYLLYSYLFLYLRSVVWSAAILLILVLSLDQIYCAFDLEVDTEGFLDILFFDIGFDRITNYLINILTIIDLVALMFLYGMRWTGSLASIVAFLERVSRIFSNHLSMAVFYLVWVVIVIILSWSCGQDMDWSSFAFLMIMGVVSSLMIFTLINGLDSFLWKHIGILSRGKSNLENLF